MPPTVEELLAEETKQCSKILATERKARAADAGFIDIRILMGFEDKITQIPVFAAEPNTKKRTRSVYFYLTNQATTCAKLRKQMPSELRSKKYRRLNKNEANRFVAKLSDAGKLAMESEDLKEKCACFFQGETKKFIRKKTVLYWKFTQDYERSAYGQGAAKHVWVQARNVLFNAYVRPLVDGEKLEGRCKNSQCLNPYHMDVF